MLDDGGEPEIVEIREEVLVDSVYLTAATYYAYWDTYNIDPYKKNPQEFKDTVKIKLYDDKHNWSFPLNRSYVTSPFAFRWYRFHFGTDLALNTGDSVKAAFDGIVRIVRWDGYGYGNYVLIRHDNGLETLYGHLSRQLVTVKQKVKAGELIGWGGSTGRSSGPHLHYETRYQGDAFNPGFIYDFVNGSLKDENVTLTKENFSYFGNIGSLQRSYMFRQAVYHRIKNGENLGPYRQKIPFQCCLYLPFKWYYPQDPFTGRKNNQGEIGELNCYSDTINYQIDYLVNIHRVVYLNNFYRLLNLITNY